MIPLFREPFYTFAFAEDRLIDRFHLEGVPAGQLVVLEGLSDSNGLLLQTETGGWVRLPEPRVVRRGQVFRVIISNQ